MTNGSSPQSGAPKMLARTAAIIQTIALVLLATDRVSPNVAVPLLALGMILWIIAFAQSQKNAGAA